MEAIIRVDALAQQLGFEVLEQGKESICFKSSEIGRPGLQFTGYYAHFDPRRVQLIGNAEMNYLYSLSHNELLERMSRFMGMDIPCVVCARGSMPPAEMLTCAKEHQVPVFRSFLSTDEAGHAICNYVARRLSRHILTHGVLMDVFGVGLLLRGESGMGKSEIALEMIRAGQRLVADDVVEVSRIGDSLIGRAPEQIRYFMEVRGIGIVDVRYLFGVGAVLPEKEIDLVVDMQYYEPQQKYLRTSGDEMRTVEILGVQLPNTVIPVSPGRNVAVVLEVVARNFRLKRLGYDPGAQFDPSALLGAYD